MQGRGIIVSEPRIRRRNGTEGLKILTTRRIAPPFKTVSMPADIGRNLISGHGGFVLTLTFIKRKKVMRLWPWKSRMNYFSQAMLVFAD